MKTSTVTDDQKVLAALRPVALDLLARNQAVLGAQELITTTTRRQA